MQPMRTLQKKVGLALALGLLLLITPVSIAKADNTADGQTLNFGPLQGQTNPYDYCCGQDYRAGSFSRTGDSGVTLRVYNNEGDWCLGGPTNWPRATAGWNQIMTPTYNNEISADAGWVVAVNCNGVHKYHIQGLHDYNVGGSSLYFGATDVGSDY